MTKTGLDKQGVQTDMFFQPSQRRHRRLQLQISERRLLLMLGDIFAVVVSVLDEIRVWSLVGGYAFNLDFVWPKTYLFLALIGLWLLLASANDLYELRIAASRMQTFRRLLIINAQMFVIYI